MKKIKIFIIMAVLGGLVPHCIDGNTSRTRGHDKRSNKNNVIHTKREIKREKRAYKAAKNKSINNGPKVVITCPKSVVVGLISVYLAGSCYALYHLLSSAEQNTILFS